MAGHAIGPKATTGRPSTASNAPVVALNLYTAPVGSNGLPLANALGNGNAPRNSERGAPFWQTDFSLLKRFYVGQRQLHLRADVINLFNQDRYDNPVNLMNSPSFGQNTNDFGRRSVLLSAKVVF